MVRTFADFLKHVRLLAVASALLFCLPTFSRAQVAFSSSELDTLVSNIALYPDPLLVHVLAASTYGEQLPPANTWAQAHSSLKGEQLSAELERANLPYDPSVLALIPFPKVLAMMCKYGSWTDQLGDAVARQKEDVFAAVQRLRTAAYNHGHLVSDDRVKVAQDEGITIMPVRTEYIYVPVYNPRVVYYVDAAGFVRISYGPGIWLGGYFGEWGWGSCWFDWGARMMYVRDTRWYAHRHIPRYPHHYRPAPRPHHRPVGPDLNARGHRNAAAWTQQSGGPVAKATADTRRHVQPNDKWSAPSERNRNVSRDVPSRNVPRTGNAPAAADPYKLPPRETSTHKVSNRDEFVRDIPSDDDGGSRNAPVRDDPRYDFRNDRRVDTQSSPSGFGGFRNGRNDSRNGSYVNPPPPPPPSSQQNVHRFNDDRGGGRHDGGFGARRR